MSSNKQSVSRNRKHVLNLPQPIPILPLYIDIDWEMQDALYTGPVRRLTQEEINELINKGELK